MKVPSLIACAVLCALTTVGFSQTNSSHTIVRPQIMGAADPSASTHFSVYLPLTNQTALEQLLNDQVDSASPSYHKWLTPAQFKAQFGPNPSDMAKVVRKLQSAGFHITAEHTQNIEVEGPVAAVENLFSTRLQQVKMANGKMKFAAANHIMVLPTELASAGAVIPEFAPHLSAHVHSERLNTSTTSVPLVVGGGKINQRLGSADSFFYATDMNQAYAFPSFTTSVTPVGGTAPVQITGAGATIGIVISSVILQSDVDATFNSNVSAGAPVDIQDFPANTTVPIPTVTIEPVLGGSGPFNPNTGDASEASLDTQMSLGTAPGAKEILYNLPDLTDESLAAGYTQVDEENRVDVVSSSFGECELDFTAKANGGVNMKGILKTFHSLFAQGNAQGITFVASSGDQGAVPCTSTAFDRHPSNHTNFVLGVQNPASDPNVTGVGGTNLQVSATPTANDNLYVSENANFDPRLPASFVLDNGDTFTVGNNIWGSGGGYSIVFAKPSYQSLVDTGSATQRAIPDVSLMMGGCPGDADLNAQNCTMLPRSAALVWIGGVPNLLIGTSSSSPQMAGVLALDIEVQGGRLGNINPQIYKLSALQTSASGKTASLSQFFHRNITGNNNGFTVSPGQAYSTVLGNGTLIVKNFLQLSGAPVAGTPSTPTNP